MPKDTKQELEYKALNMALKHIATKFSNLRFPVDSNERVPNREKGHERSVKVVSSKLWALFDEEVLIESNALWTLPDIAHTVWMLVYKAKDIGADN